MRSESDAAGWVADDCAAAGGSAAIAAAVELAKLAIEANAVERTKSRRFITNLCFEKCNDE
jgi:hypothetical protein